MKKNRQQNLIWGLVFCLVLVAPLSFMLGCQKAGELEPDGATVSQESTQDLDSTKPADQPKLALEVSIKPLELGSVVLPQVTSEARAAQQINLEIEQLAELYAPDPAQEKAGNRGSFASTYTVYEDQEILSLMVQVWPLKGGPLEQILSYNLDKMSGDLLSQEEFLAYLGIETPLETLIEENIRAYSEYQITGIPYTPMLEGAGDEAYYAAQSLNFYWHDRYADQESVDREQVGEQVGLYLEPTGRPMLHYPQYMPAYDRYEQCKVRLFDQAGLGQENLNPEFVYLARASGIDPENDQVEALVWYLGEFDQKKQEYSADFRSLTVLQEISEQFFNKYYYTFWEPDLLAQYKLNPDTNRGQVVGNRAYLIVPRLNNAFISLAEQGDRDLDPGFLGGDKAMRSCLVVLDQENPDLKLTYRFRDRIETFSLESGPTLGDLPKGFVQGEPVANMQLPNRDIVEDLDLMSMVEQTEIQSDRHYGPYRADQILLPNINLAGPGVERVNSLIQGLADRIAESFSSQQNDQDREFYTAYYTTYESPDLISIKLNLLIRVVNNSELTLVFNLDPKTGELIDQADLLQGIANLDLESLIEENISLSSQKFSDILKSIANYRPDDDGRLENRDPTELAASDYGIFKAATLKYYWDDLKPAEDFLDWLSPQDWQDFAGNKIYVEPAGQARLVYKQFVPGGSFYSMTDLPLRLWNLPVEGALNPDFVYLNQAFDLGLKDQDVKALVCYLGDLKQADYQDIIRPVKKLYASCHDWVQPELVFQSDWSRDTNQRQIIGNQAFLIVPRYKNAYITLYTGEKSDYSPDLDGICGMQMVVAIADSINPDSYLVYRYRDQVELLGLESDLTQADLPKGFVAGPDLSNLDLELDPALDPADNYIFTFDRLFKAEN